MEAKQAIRLTEEALGKDSLIIAPYLESVYKKIEKFAKGGKSYITHPFSELKKEISYPGYDIQKSVFSVLRQQGFTVEHIPDPDPGHPASSPYDKISW